VAAGGEEFAELRGGTGDCVGCGDARDVEAIVQAVGDEGGLELRGSAFGFGRVADRARLAARNRFPSRRSPLTLRL
jgi:hypothetical protein